MVKSIAQLVEKMLTNIGNIFYEEVSNGSGDIDSCCVRTQQKSANFAKNILNFLVKDLDEQIKKSKERRKEYVVERQNYKRELITEIGEIELSRTLYKNKYNGKYECLIDKFLKVKRSQRISNGAKAKYVSEAIDTSYSKAANNEVSRQTVCNIVHSLIDINKSYPVLEKKEQKILDRLYIEADEDHIHLNNGKSAMVRIVYVYEGKEDICKNRRKLINCRYFASLKEEPEALWEEVQEYVYSTYNIDNSKILIQGDGANWIKKGMEFFYGCEFMLDTFHVYKSIKTVTTNEKLRKKIISAVKGKNTFALNELYKQAYSETVDENHKNRVLSGYRYITTHWDKIHLDNPEYACCTEGHVGHILSDRLSRKPLGWSVIGAENISKLRAFKYNNGDIKELVKQQNVTATIEPVKKLKIKNKKLKNQTIYHNIPALNAGTSSGILTALNGIINGGYHFTQLFS